MTPSLMPTTIQCPDGEAAVFAERTQLKRREKGSANLRAIERVIAALRQKPESNFTLKRMAHIALISPCHFSRLFRRFTGIPPCLFRSMLRIEKAKKLLIASDIPIVDVSMEVGYRSLGTFTRLFSQGVGVTPNRLRQAAKSAELPELGETLDPIAPFAEPSRADGGVISGHVGGPENLEGLIFIGLFHTPIPQGFPLACTVLHRPGPYTISHIPDGVFYLMAAALSGARSLSSRILLDDALRGMPAVSPLVVNNGRAQKGGVDIELRAAKPTDPPIVTALLALTAKLSATAIPA